MNRSFLRVIRQNEPAQRTEQVQAFTLHVLFGIIGVVGWMAGTLFWCVCEGLAAILNGCNEFLFVPLAEVGRELATKHGVKIKQ